MKVFVIGATGLIGGHAARALVREGHQVTGLARSAESEAKLKADGIGAIPGDAEDRPALLRGVLDADAVIFAPSLGEAEGAVVAWLLEQMEGSDKAFIFTSGTGVLAQRTAGDWSEDTFAEDDPFTPLRAIATRVAIEDSVRAAVSRGIRGMVVRPPAVWTHEKPHMLVAGVVASVEKTGAACYIGRGLNMYSHIHAADLGEAYRHVVERGTPGALYHAVAGEVANRWIAEKVAAIMGVEARSITMDDAVELWGKFATVVVAGVSSRSRSPRTRREFGWAPQHTDMLAAGEAWLKARLKEKVAG